jgi:3',5'-cyclic AMP phosphodiesterase CpdA
MKRSIYFFIFTILAAVIISDIYFYRSIYYFKKSINKLESLVNKAKKIPANSRGESLLGKLRPTPVRVSTVTEDTVTLIWDTFEKEKSKAYIFTKDLKLKKILEDKEVNNHKVTFTNLNPNTIYHFFIETTDGQSPVGYVQTLKIFPGKPDFCFAAIACTKFDPGERDNYFIAVAEEVNKMDHIDFVLFPGDLVANNKYNQNPKEENIPIVLKNMDYFKEIITKFLKKPYYLAAGDHDALYIPKARAHYRRLHNLSREYYSIDLYGRHFVILFNEKEANWRLDEEQYKWLQEDLNLNKDKDVYVVVHFGVYDDPYKCQEGRGVDERLQKMLEEHGRVRAVYSGSKNSYSSSLHNNILYVSCPMLGNSPYGYIEVRVYKDGLQQIFHNTPNYKNAASFDKFSIQDPNKYLYAVFNDSQYCWGRVEDRNFSWEFGKPTLSTRVY